MTEGSDLRRLAVREIAPKLAQISAEVLMGDVWNRPGLSLRNRSLVTVAALVALGRDDQLASHLERALDHGVTPDEIGEVVTHLAFYCGWPAAVTAASLAKSVLDSRTA